MINKKIAEHLIDVYNQYDAFILLKISEYEFNKEYLFIEYLVTNSICKVIHAEFKNDLDNEIIDSCDENGILLQLSDRNVQRINDELITASKCGALNPA